MEDIIIKKIADICSEGNIEKINYYLDSGFEINTNLGGISYVTALGIALRYKHFELAEFLIKKGANLEISGYTLFDSISDELDHLVFEFDGGIKDKNDPPDVEMTTFLVNNGANVNQINIFLETPLNETFSKYNPNIIIHKPAYYLLKSKGAKTINELINEGFDINSEFKNGKNRLETAILEYCTSSGQILELIKLGCKTSDNFDINAPIEDGKNLLDIAINDYWCSTYQANFLRSLGAKTSSEL